MWKLAIALAHTHTPTNHDMRMLGYYSENNLHKNITLSLLFKGDRIRAILRFLSFMSFFLVWRLMANYYTLSHSLATSAIAVAHFHLHDLEDNGDGFASVILPLNDTMTMRQKPPHQMTLWMVCSKTLIDKHRQTSWVKKCSNIKCQ